MTDDEKIAHLERALQEPEGKYSHDQIRDRLTALRGAGGGRSIDLGPGSKDSDQPAFQVAESPVPRPMVSMDKPRPGNEPLEHDPIAQGIVAGAIGTAAGAGAGFLTRLAAPSLAPVATSATANGVAAAAQGDDLKGSGRAAAIGALLGVPSAARRLITQAPSAVDARLQSSIDPGRGASARRVAAALPAAKEVIDATPGLKRTLITSQSPGEKAMALGDAIAPDVAANNLAMDRLGAFHGGDNLPADRPYGPFPGRSMTVPIRTPATSLGEVGQQARQGGNFKLEDAATRMAEDLRRGATVSGRTVGIPVETLRGMRNLAAEHVESMTPSSGNPKLASLNERNADALRGALSDSFERLAVPGTGVNPAEMAARNRRIASVIPLQRSLEGQELAAGLGPEDGLAIPHTKWQLARKMAHMADRAPALTDLRLSGPAFQRVGGVLPEAPGSGSPLPASPDPLIRIIRGRRKKDEEQTNAN